MAVRYHINNAVLYLPAKANVTEEICNFVDQKCPIPPFYDPASRAELERKAILGFPVDAAGFCQSEGGFFILCTGAMRTSCLPQAMTVVNKDFYNCHSSMEL
jgi:hypothetical protein